MVKRDNPSTDATAHCGIAESGGAPPQTTEGGGDTARAGAPPGNTAPANYTGPDPGTRILHSGVDSLYVTYAGEVRDEVGDQLEALKDLAQSDDPAFRAKAVFETRGHRFEVWRKGSGKFPFVLVDNWFFIQVSRATTRYLPLAKVQIASELLTRCGVDAALEAAYQVVQTIGAVDYGIKVHRIDLCVDFVTEVDIEAIARTQWVTRSRQYREYWEGDVYTGLTFGLGGDLACRLYNKTEELKNSGKTYLYDRWAAAGWGGRLPVWRLEFELKRTLLRDLGLPEERDVLANLDGLWRYCTEKWLRLCLPDQRANQTRWATHPLWAVLQAVSWGTSSTEPLSRVTKARLPSAERLYVQGLAPITSYMASKGIDDLETALRGLLQEADDYYQSQDLDLEHYVRQKVMQKAQRYNTLTEPQRRAAARKAYQSAKEGE